MLVVLMRSYTQKHALLEELRLT